MIRLLTLLCALALPLTMTAQVDARLFQYPDVSASHIAFSYGGDIWVVPKTGGTAVKLSSPKGGESFPRFSPDGEQLAFSGNYDGNTDIYVVPVQGGIPQRVTHHGMSDRLLDWYPDGEHLLYATSMHSGKQRFSQLYKIPASGGLPEKLPMAYGEFGSLSPDASKIAFTDRSRLFRTWKRYRGGTAPDIYLFDLETLESENITNNPANDELPMWSGDKVYFLSDQGDNQRFNIWVYDTKTKEQRQLTEFSDYDVHFPAIGPQEIVFEAGGKIHLLDLESEQHREIDIQVVSDFLAIKPRKESVEDYLQGGTLSPDGKRVVLQARGDLFSLPSEKGYVQNLSHTPGVFERNPAWSPDGKYLAYWSDASGEYELTIRDMAKGSGETTVSKLGPGFRYNLYWSPDGNKLAFVDQTMHIHVIDRESGAVDVVDQDPSLFEGGLRGWGCSWSPDSRWLAYAKTLGNGNNAIFLYNLESGESTQATSGFYSDLNPVFSPDGKYLFLNTNRNFDPIYSDFDNTWVYPNATQLAVITLQQDVESPLAAENDEVAIAEDEAEKEGEEPDSSEEDAENEEEEEETTVVDLENFERRLVVLPPEGGNMGDLEAVEGKVLFMRYPNSGAADGQSTLMYYDLEEREEKTILSGVNAYWLSADGKKILVRQGNRMGMINVAADQKLDKTLALGDMEMAIDPRAEWQQIFNDAWRFQRDFFYDKNMHGVDWEAMRERYGSLIQYAVSRDDLNFILGELIGELNASHTYRGGGDGESPERKAVGYLGVDWEKNDGQFRVARIVRGAPWDNEVRSPLDEPGVDIAEGDYILAVNGIPLADFTDPWAAFEGLAGKTVELTVNDTPTMDGARTEVVETLRDETRLRNLAWIDANRRRVDEASNGTIGYIYVPSTGYDGQQELVRQFYGQWDKAGLIVDERFNNGGQIPDRFIELLNRKPLAFWAVRDGQNWQWPPVAHFGPMAMLINGWAGSGGDAFPDYFRKAGLGPLVGARTWGGLIGISGAPSLIDGGTVTVPTFRMYNPDGTWFEEGHGVEPDIEVLEDPTALAKGVDPQLERAIEEVMQQIEKLGPVIPEAPAPEDRSRVIKP